MTNFDTATLLLISQRTLLSVREEHIVTKIGANPPVKVRRSIKPQPIGFLTPLGSQEPYRPRYSPDFRFGARRSPAGSIYSVAESTAEEQENRSSEDEIPEVGEDTLSDSSEDYNSDSTGEEPELDLFPPAPGVGADNIHNQLQDLQLVEDQPALQMAAIDIADVLQAMEGADAQARNDAMVNLARYVQNLPQAEQPAAPAAAQRLTIREALREGETDELKVTDLMPDAWGSTKDGEPESHCHRFEIYTNMHGYDDDANKIALFQASLKGDALT